MSLSMEKRNLGEKNKEIRKAGYIPGILYGGEQNIPIKIPLKDFSNIIHTYGMSKVIDIVLDGKTHHSIIKDFQLDVLTDNFIHFDLLEVSKTKEIRIPVPIHLEGNAQGILEGGVLEILLDSVPVVGTLTDIPSEFKLDISSLKIGESIHIRDLKIPKNCRIIGDLDSALVLIASPEQETPEDETPEA